MWINEVGVLRPLVSGLGSTSSITGSNETGVANLNESGVANLDMLSPNLLMYCDNLVVASVSALGDGIVCTCGV